MFQKIAPLIQSGVILNLNITRSDENPEVLIVSTVAKTAEDNEDSGQELETAPLLISGLPEELDAEFADQLIKREKNIKITFKIEAGAFDRSLLDINTEAEDAKARAEKQAEQKAKGKGAPAAKKLTPAQQLDADLDVIHELITVAKTRKELEVEWKKLNDLAKKNRSNTRIPTMIKSCTGRMMDIDEKQEKKAAAIPFNDPTESADPDPEDEFATDSSEDETPEEEQAEETDEIAAEAAEIDEEEEKWL